MSNRGNYIVSLSNLCKWLGQQAESLGVEIYPGFPAHDLIIEDGVVKGVITGDLGVAKDGHHKDSLHAGHGIARQIHVVRGRRARLAVKTAWARTSTCTRAASRRNSASG